MMDLDLVARSLLEVRRELSPSRADKDRVREKLGWTALGSREAGVSEAGALKPMAQRLGERAALRASGKLGVAVGALLFGAGVGVGLWLGSASQARQTQAIVPAPAELAPSTLEPSSTLDRTAAPVPAPSSIASDAELAPEQRTAAAKRSHVPKANPAEGTGPAARSRSVVAHSQPAARVAVEPRAPV
ncbi:MAG TPA: hypothetical protein VG963_22615, partial [Polyangiaceae bacterium]|nr:hypothetical protein [Polyangiaceae bacterium]